MVPDLGHRLTAVELLGSCLRLPNRYCYDVLRIFQKPLLAKTSLFFFLSSHLFWVLKAYLALAPTSVRYEFENPLQIASPIIPWALKKKEDILTKELKTRCTRTFFFSAYLMLELTRWHFYTQPTLTKGVINTFLSNRGSVKGKTIWGREK